MPVYTFDRIYKVRVAIPDALILLLRTSAAEQLRPLDSAVAPALSLSKLSHRRKRGLAPRALPGSHRPSLALKQRAN